MSDRDLILSLARRLCAASECLTAAAERKGESKFAAKLAEFCEGLTMAIEMTREMFDKFVKVDGRLRSLNIRRTNIQTVYDRAMAEVNQELAAIQRDCPHDFERPTKNSITACMICGARP